MSDIKTITKTQALQQAAETFLSGIQGGPALLKDLRRKHNLTLQAPVRGGLRQGAAKQAANSHTQQVIELARKRGFKF